MDANPYSPTYGQERTDRILDTEECQTQQPANYVHVYTYCEMNANGSYTGNCVKVYEDVEPLSPTYGQQMEEVSADGVLCPPDSTESDWQTIDTYCEQIAYQPSGKLGNSGYMVTVQQDMSEYSPTYGQTRENRTQDVVQCTPPDTSDVWVVTGTECEYENGVRTGNKITYRVEVNEYSPNYNFGATETLIERDLMTCPRSAQAPDWELQSASCEYDNYGYATGYIINTYVDDNRLSSTYGQTKTERELNVADCPPDEQQMVLWRFINNRGVSTDTITSATIHMDYNFDIPISGSIPPAGGSLSGSTIIPKILVTAQAQLVTLSVDVSPNTSLPVEYQYSQSPNPYVYNASTTLVITLWDGDGTGPEWTEVSYVCETVSGYRTGAAIITEEDMNPDSATYGQTRTRTVENDSRCPAQTDGDWVETSWSCQQENGYNTGYVISVQRDQNPNSSTYNSTRTRLVYDTTRCPIDANPDWVVISTTCEQGEQAESRDFKFQWWKTIDNVETYGQEDCGSGFDGPYACSTKIIFGECMTSLGTDYAMDKTSLAYVDLWRTITSIGDNAFWGCSRLETVIVRNTTPPTLGANVFYGTNSRLKIYVPDSSVSAYQSAWTEYASKIEPISNLT